MSTLVFEAFRGELPRENRRNKEGIFASCAVNVSVQDGAISPLPCPELQCSHNFMPHEIFGYNGCDCVAFEKPTILAEDANFFYWVEEGERARKSPKECFCDGVSYRLGMPCPSRAPSAAGGGGNSCEDVDPKTYFYTYVAKFCGGCESESPLSPPSKSVVCGGSVAVSGFGGAPPGYGITHVRVYRTVAGWKSGQERGASTTGDVVLIGETGVGGGITDSGDVGKLGMISPITHDMESMPSNPDGVGVSAFSTFAWKGKDLYFSADGLIDVYREEGHLCFDHDIISAKSWNQSIYVFTEKNIYRVDESSGDGGVRYSNPPSKFEHPSRVANPYSMSVGHSGVYYMSTSGLAVVSSNTRGNSIAFPPIMTTEQWRSLDLSRAKTMVYDHYVFVFSPDWSYTIVLENTDGVFGESEYATFFRYPHSISAMWIDDQADLLFATTDGDVHKFLDAKCWDEMSCDGEKPICTPCCPYTYTIDLRGQAEVGGFAAAYINIDPYYGSTTFRLLDKSCGNKVLFEKEIEGCADHEFKLPGCVSSSTHLVVEFEGCAKIYPQSRIGTSAKIMGQNQ